MSIWVDEEQKIFHLQSKDTSYIMRVVKGRYLARVLGKEDTYPGCGECPVKPLDFIRGCTGWK